MNGSLLGREPTLILYAVLTGLTAVQWGAVSMPTWAHVLVTVVIAALAALVNRSQVTPVLKSGPAPAGVGKSQP